MNAPSKTPTYNLKVVIRETGLNADTLRAWHRLYSQYDIEIIKWLMERQKEGLRIYWLRLLPAIQWKII